MGLDLCHRIILKISITRKYLRSLCFLISLKTKHEMNANNQVAVIECINQVVLMEYINCYAYKENAAILVIQFSQHAIATHAPRITDL